LVAIENVFSVAIAPASTAVVPVAFAAAFILANIAFGYIFFSL
jgi:hypothetical protein